MTFLDAALFYAKQGISVFPIEPRGKKPLTAHGFKEASKDEPKIRDWWRKWPDANIGIATGGASGGIYVIDLDVDDERGLDGWHEFEEWGREHGLAIPDTWMAVTGRGGYHMYLRSVNPVHSHTHVLDGVDIRGEGGYVVAPPSVHANGQSYCWETNWEDCQIAEADEVIEKLTERPIRHEAPDAGFAVPQVIPKGQRNDFLFKAAASMQSKGYADSTIMAAIKEENEQKCESALPESEVEGIVKSVIERYAKGPSTIAGEAAGADEDAPPQLRMGKEGPLQITANVVEVLERDKGLKGSICYNELAHAPYVCGSLPWDQSGEMRPWGNFDDANLVCYVEAVYKLKTRTKVFEALNIVMDRHRINPVKDMLEALYSKWDGKSEHIESLLPDYLGVEQSIYSTEVMKLFMLGAITRAYRPGTKFDYMPVLVGEQGIGKSTFFRFLAMDDRWFDDNFNSIESQQAAERLQGMWMVEMAELLATKRAKEIESIKAFLTSTADNYRQPYERRTEKRLRMCVFAGTTNSEYFLTDRTGNRRFLPLVARGAYIQKSLFENEESVTEDFSQAWGEAMDIFKKANEKPRLMLPAPAAAVALEQQRRFTEDDPIVGIIQHWLDTAAPDRVCAAMIWEKALKRPAQPEKRDSHRILEILANDVKGWERKGNARCGQYGPTTCFERRKAGGVDKVDNDVDKVDNDVDNFRDQSPDWPLGFDEIVDDSEIPFD